MQLPQLARALTNRNFRLFFVGQGLSLIGTWMQQVAAIWLVYRLTDSPILLGVVGFAGQIPTFFLAPFAGVLSDRWSRQRTLLVTQVLAMLQAGALATVTLTGVVEVWQVIVLSSVLGLINAFDMPTRQAFLSETVQRREDLANAIALNSSMVNVARLIGPAVAGFLISTVGEGICFLLNSVSYVAVIAALLGIRVTPRATARRNPLLELREGFAYAFGYPPIATLLVFVAAISFAAMPLATLMPIFATKVLHGTSWTLGLLTSFSGCGALAGGIYLASRSSVLGLGRVIWRMALLLGLGMVGFAFSNLLPLSLAFVLVNGFCMIVQLASCNTLLQTFVREEQRGRVMSFYTMSFIGMAPIGSLTAGTLAEMIGAPQTVALAGLVCMTASAVFAWRLPALRTMVYPLYVERGIIPEVAQAIQSTSQLTVPPEEPT